MNASNKFDGKIEYVWAGKNNTFWALVSYWVGTGYQRVEMQITKSVFDGVESGVY